MRSSRSWLAAAAAGVVLCVGVGDAQGSRLREAVVAPPVDAVQPDRPAISDQWLYLGPQRPTLSRLAISRINPGLLMAVTDGADGVPYSGRLYESSEAGLRWRHDPYAGASVADVAFDERFRALYADSFGLWFREAGQPQFDLAVHPTLGTALRTERLGVGPGADAPVWVAGSVAGADNRVFRINADLTDWTETTPALPARVQAAELAVSPTQPGQVAVAAVDAGSGLARVFVTRDNGANWAASDTPVPVAGIQSLHWVGDTLYLGGWSVSIDTPTLHLVQTSDDGLNWTVSLGSAVTGAPAIDITHDPDQPQRRWVGDSLGLLRSTDGGATWGRVDGLTDAVTRVVYEPFHGQLWAAVRGRGLWVSDDGGDTWAARDEQLGSLSTVSVAANRDRPGEVAVAVDSWLSQRGEVAVSLDGGLDWAQDLAPASNSAGAVAFDAQGRLLATLSGLQDATLFRRDAGGEWQHIGFDWPANSLVQPGVVARGVGVDTLLVAARVFDHGTGSVTSQLWRSGNGGGAWQPVLVAAEGTGLVAIERTAGPNGPRLFVLEQGYLSEHRDILWASDDDGLGWFQVGAGLPATIQGMVCAGSGGQVLLYGTDRASYALGIHRSLDGGQTWVRTDWTPGTFFDGTPFSAMHCPGDAMRVFLGGPNGWVWLSEDRGNSLGFPLASPAVWGENLVRQLQLTPSGLYAATAAGAWVNPDLTGAPTGPWGLTVNQQVLRMRYSARLAWSGGAAQVQVRRNGVVVATVANTGSWTTSGLSRDAGQTWQVCDLGGECSGVVAP